MKGKIKTICAYFLIAFNFIVGAISVYTTIKELTDKKHLIIVGIIVVTGMSGAIAYIVDKAHRPLTDRMNALTEGSVTIAEHYKIQMFELMECFKRSCKPHELKKELLSGCLELVKNIQYTLQNATGKKVRVCIKMIRDDNDNELYTYCRDNLTIGQCKNEHNQHISITQNTDFYNIVAGNADVFVANDLQKEHEKGIYFNSTHDFKYVSTIVVPIRLLYYRDDLQNNTSEYYGFLCVDSKHKNIFGDSEGKVYVDFIKSAAHYLYSYLSLGEEYYLKTVENYKKGE